MFSPIYTYSMHMCILVCTCIYVHTYEYVYIRTHTQTQIYRGIQKKGRMEVRRMGWRRFFFSFELLFINDKIYLFTYLELTLPCTSGIDIDIPMPFLCHSRDMIINMLVCKFFVFFFFLSILPQSGKSHKVKISQRFEHIFC